VTRALDEALVARLRAAGCVWAEEEAVLLQEAALSSRELDDLAARRVAGEPLELVLGWVEFLGRRLVVAPGVFVPRRRTELLARTARDLAAHVDRAVVVEMCCGVGPVAAVLEGAAEVHAADLSGAALDCARLNAPGAALHLGDLYDALPSALAGRFDVLAANAPYVPTGRIASMPAEARDHEPRVALDGGGEGVDLHRRLAAGAPAWLAPGGVLLVETSPAQAGLTTAAMQQAGLETEVLVDAEVDGCVAVGRLNRAGAGTA
jgi:release factor glutamine methyltransferase